MLIIDRIEGEYAVCELSDEQENTTNILVKLDRLPQNVKEGDVIVIKDDHYEICEEETQKRREKIIGLSNSLFE